MRASLALSLLVVWAALPLCRFTVRDVAFVELDDRAWRLELQVPATELAAARQRVAAELADANVELDARAGDVRRLTLRAADGERELDIDASGELRAAVRGVVRSPLRARLLEELPRRYAVLLLATRGEASSDAELRGAARDALDELDTVIEHAPKPVGRAPLVVELTPAERRAERILLWSLGVDPDPAAGPAAVALFGRGRRIGPPLRGAELDAATLFGVLAIAGLSCECDLDRSWMTGRRVPLCWDDQVRERSAAELGFDPDSPFVRSEVSSILAHGVAAPAASGADDGSGFEELLRDYTEVVEDAAGPEAPADAQRALLEQAPRDAQDVIRRNAAAGGGDAEPPARDRFADLPEARSGPAVYVFYAIGALLSVGLLVGGVLLARRAGRS